MIFFTILKIAMYVSVGKNSAENVVLVELQSVSIMCYMLCPPGSIPTCLKF